MQKPTLCLVKSVPFRFGVRGRLGLKSQSSVPLLSRALQLGSFISRSSLEVPAVQRALDLNV